MAFEWNFMIDIRPNWLTGQPAANWETAVRSDLIRVGTVRTGRLLLNAIRFFHQWVVIAPYDGSLGPCNAGESTRDGQARDGTPYGATVPFSPHLFQAHGACHLSAPINNGQASNEILFHELVHAFRTVSGKDSTQPATGGLIYYDDTEEFVAILLTNIFVTDPSNRVRTGLRRDHQDGAGLEPSLATSLGFFASSRNTADLVGGFCADHPVLSTQIAAVPATFNPVAAFLEHPAQARERSASATATIRDAAGWSTAIGGFLQGVIQNLIP
jgi:hypothetical protein